MLHQAWEKLESDDIDTWIKTMRSSCAQFSYWYTVLELECILLLFVQSIREANLPMFINSLEKVVPWMFALDHTNYSRWLPIYLKSLRELHLVHSTVFEEFRKGFFTVNKTNRLFSYISDDHAHEQNNKLIKSDGGVVGILDSVKALLKWMISGPIIASVITKVNLDIANTKSHHENNQIFEQRFQKTLLTWLKNF